MKKYRSLSIYVIFSITILIIYTIISQVIFIKTGQEYDTLTTCFFAAFGGEILACALMKIFKLKKEDGSNE